MRFKSDPKFECHYYIGANSIQLHLRRPPSMYNDIIIMAYNVAWKWSSCYTDKTHARAYYDNNNVRSIYDLQIPPTALYPRVYYKMCLIKTYENVFMLITRYKRWSND